MPREISEKLRFREGTERTLPTMILYDEHGLRLFEDITYLDEYYLTNAEIEVLNKYAQEIANIICSNSRIVELGSGYETALTVDVVTIRTSSVGTIKSYCLDYCNAYP